MAVSASAQQSVDSTRVHADAQSPRSSSDVPFILALVVIALLYVGLILAMLLADVAYLRPADGSGFGHETSTIVHRTFAPLATPAIRYSLKLSLISCTITAILSIWVAVPLGYLMSRFRFPLKGLIDAILDIPIVLPPLVIGLSLLILFQSAPGRALEKHFPVTYAIPSVILAQFAVSCAFAVRTMRVSFDQINPRAEHVAMTLGCNRAQAFWRVAVPEARRGILTAGTLAWARAMGEFGPVLVFAGATRMTTEVLPTSIYLEMSVGNIEAAVAISLLMVMVAMIVLLIVRFIGGEGSLARAVAP